MSRWVALFAVVMLALALMAAPALGTVHPIQSGDCNGFNEPHSPSGGDPPGITGQSNADNFAQPLVAISTAASTHNPAAFNAANGDNGNCPNGSDEF